MMVMMNYEMVIMVAVMILATVMIDVDGEHGLHLDALDCFAITVKISNYPQVDAVVVTDGSRVLGLGDLGIGGLGISIGLEINISVIKS